MSVNRYNSESRNQLETEENGEPRGDMAATNTSVSRGGMNKRGGWNAKPTNRRKGVLEEHYWVNVLPIRKNPVNYQKLFQENELEFGGVNLEDINADLEAEGNGEMTIINSGPFKKAVRHDEEDLGLPYNTIMPQMVEAGLKIINPNNVISLSGDKAQQNRFFSDLGFVPHWAESDNYAHEGGIQELEDRLEPFEGVPIISKPKGKSGGDGIEFRYSDELIDDLEFEKERRGIEGALPGYIFQTTLPVEGDVRVIAFGDTPITGEVRYGRDDIDLHNLSQMDEEMDQFELVESGAADPVDIQKIDQAYVNATEDIHELMLDRGYIDGENTELFLGHDFLKVDPSKDEHNILDYYPDRALDNILVEDYKTEDGSYLVFAETNASPGYKIDMINYEYPNQHSALNLLKAADDFSKGVDFEPFKPGEVHEDDLEALSRRYPIK